MYMYFSKQIYLCHNPLISKWSSPNSPITIIPCICLQTMQQSSDVLCLNITVPWSDGHIRVGLSAEVGYPFLQELHTGTEEGCLQIAQINNLHIAGTGRVTIMFQFIQCMLAQNGIIFMVNHPCNSCMKIFYFRQMIKTNSQSEPDLILNIF